ncbi:MAG: tetratricopeptide repeat protein [Myxococcales bacterium]|nr:tetratricopeptide repeat protein [Myxococcales bacterium]
MAKSSGSHPLAEARASAWDNIADKLDRAPGGLHQLAEPTVDVPLDWPSSLVELYLVFGGGELFLAELIILPPSAVTRDAPGWRFASIGDDTIWVTGKNTILRGEASDDGGGTPMLDGTRLDRWLHGIIDALALLFDVKGEYVDWLDQAPDAPMARAQLKRDPKAPGPRLRLARALLAAGDAEKARDEFEDVLAALPENIDAWLDLAHTSELLGDVAGAYEEAVTAATVSPNSPQCAHAWAVAARLALAAGRDADHQTAAERFALTPQGGSTLAEIIDTGHHALTAAEIPTAQYQLEMALAVAPDAPEVVAFARAVASAVASEN